MSLDCKSKFNKFETSPNDSIEVTCGINTTNLDSGEAFSTGFEVLQPGEAVSLFEAGGCPGTNTIVLTTLCWGSTGMYYNLESCICAT